MAYIRYKYKFKYSIEYEFHWIGNFGAKGETRSPKMKKTKEQIAISNQLNKEIRMRRVLKMNFDKNDLWICLKYPSGTRKNIEEVERDRANFLKKLRTEYKKAGSELKFVSRMEIGANGGLHFHMVVNRIPDKQTDIIVNNCWSKILRKPHKLLEGEHFRSDGLVDYKSLYDIGDLEGLAKYICKKPKENSEEYKQLSLFEQKEQKKFLKISSSRNLLRPVPEKKEYKRRTVRKIIEEGPEATEGYFIDQDSIRVGVNPFTGLSYLKYTEIKLDPVEKKTEKRGSPP